MEVARQGNWKSVIDGNTQFVFDPDADIGRQRNAFATHPEVAGELSEALAEWERSVTDSPTLGPSS